MLLLSQSVSQLDRNPVISLLKEACNYYFEVKELGRGGLTMLSLTWYLTPEIIQNHPAKTDMHAASVGLYVYLL